MTLIVLFALMIFLFLCNFMSMGIVGTFFSNLMFGLFGFPAYILPVFFFAVYLYYILSVDTDPKIVSRVIAVIGLFLIFTIFSEMAGCDLSAQQGYDPAGIYSRCAQGRSGGGLIGGTMAFVLYSLLRTVGMVILLIVLLLICIYVIGQRSFLLLFRDRARDLQSARRERMEEEERYRREHPEEFEDEPDEEDGEYEDEYAAEEGSGPRSRRNGTAGRERREEEPRDEGGRRPQGRRRAAPDVRQTDEDGVVHYRGFYGDTDLSADDFQNFPEQMRQETVSAGEPAGETAPSAAEQAGRGDGAFGTQGEAQTVSAAEPPEENPPGAPQTGSGPDPSEEFFENPFGAAPASRQPEDSFRQAEPEETQVPIDPFRSADLHEIRPEDILTGSPSEGMTGAAGRSDAIPPAGEGAQEEDLFTYEAVRAEGAGPLSDPAGHTGEENPLSDPAVLTGEEEPLSEDSVPMREEISPPDPAVLMQEEDPVSEAAVHTEREEAPSEVTVILSGENMESGGSSGQKRAGGASGPAAGRGADAARSRTYTFPPMDLLHPGQGAGADSDEELRSTARTLQETLASFGVSVKITDISQGPSVTRYEMLPETGVKVSRIVSLSDDIKLALAATDIRIEAPIPGKSAIGIEVPNREAQPVMLRDIVESAEFRGQKSKLAFAVGKDIAGKPVCSDIAKMPHVLIAGATGSGKSVCINTIIMSILYHARPDEVKFIMIDPKVVELSVYNGIPHLLIPVVTNPQKATAALNWAVSEMEARYRAFADAKVRDIRAYNALAGQGRENGADSSGLQPMPQIVVIVDELADLMMVAKNDVETAICRLAQLARAAGIHLIIATQRPSVDVITGLIKANMPSRIAFRVSSGVDSRTILDMNGAEKLLGRGDMLFFPQGLPKPTRIQGCYVSDEEVNDVASFLIRSNEVPKEEAERFREAVNAIEAGSSAGGSGSDQEGAAGSEPPVDELFADAGAFIIEKNNASIGLLQRRYRIGFNRAARIMDQLCEAGVVSESEGTKARTILMTPAQFESWCADNGVRVSGAQ